MKSRLKPCNPRPRQDVKNPTFAEINNLAVRVLPYILARVLPGGRMRQLEYVVLNPRRSDQSLGSFSVNIRTGKWADFATGDKGGDPVSLVAYLEDIGQRDALKLVAQMVGYS